MQSNHSCYHPTPKHWIPEDIKDNPSGLHNTQWKKEQRKKMLTGERPEECSYCWGFEDLNKNLKSDRMVFNDKNGTFGDLVNKTTAFTGDEDVNPRYIEVAFNNRCNLKCSYCSPGQSSRWHEEIRTQGPYPVDDPTVRFTHDHVEEDENIYIKAFWEWLPDLYPDLRFLRITGGEPLMSHSADKLMDYVADRYHSELTLAYNTNLCTPDRRINHLLKQAERIIPNVKEFRVYTSCESYGEQAEYIRHGFEWDKWCKNVERLAQAKVPVTVMATAGALSVFEFRKFVGMFIKWRNKGYNVIFTASALVNPDHFDIRIFNDEEFYEDAWDDLWEYYNYVKDKLDEQEIRTLDNLFEFRKNPLPNQTHLRDQFKIFFTEHDKRRDTDIVKAFPMLKDLFNE